MNRRSGGDRRRVRQGRWLGKHREAMRNAWRQLRERPGAHAFALGLLALALLALLLLRVGVDQFQHLGSPLSQARTLSLFLDPALDETAAQALANELDGDARVAELDRISPAQGLRELLHGGAHGEALAALPDNPLPWVLAVDPVDRGSGEALIADWQERPEIEHIADDADWHARADAVLRAARTLVAVLSTLVGLAAVLLAANAVRTLRVEGREERALQRVFGAAEADLHRPYLWLGGLYGLIAGAVAVLLAWVALIALRPGLNVLAEALQLESTTLRQMLVWTVAIPPVAAVLGAVGAWIGCRFEPDLEGGQ